MPDDDTLRKQLIELLLGGHAHDPFERAVDGLPIELAGSRAPGLPHSSWELVEHLRIAQEDILKFSQGPGHESPKWPEGYWPAAAAPPDPGAWQRSVAAFLASRNEFSSLLQERGRKLDEAFPWGQGQTLLREALLLADHNSYHLGQLILVRRALGAWPPA